ncbi:hypothetical protein QFZ52_000610 [Arthrobacter woluwensis]|uniref:DUF4307 domain-containing protein n=1 Tax=Arthrobacter woluwensis TaxID=156980 RepID=UPI00277E15FF|nr:DUF4307 domain-containing protein [Arthrobacter woluwensis]MDQ0707958.1 hypothetical protein [Arthrobacter woluwensis]
MTPSQSPTPMESSLSNRYGRQKRSVTRRTKLLILVAALVLAVGAAGFLAIRNSVSTVDFKTVSFSANDPSFAEVDFQVSKDRDSAAVCAIKALDDHYAVVGWKYVDVPPNAADFGAENGQTTQRRVTVRTESLAVSGVVDSCWLKR